MLLQMTLKNLLSHLTSLTGKRTMSMSIPDGISTDQDWDDDIQITIPEFSRRMRHLNSVLNHFWKRWKGEYLLELQESHRYGSSGAQTTISAGDIVLVHDDVPWVSWRLAKVEVVIEWDSHNRGAVEQLYEYLEEMFKIASPPDIATLPIKNQLQCGSWEWRF